MGYKGNNPNFYAYAHDPNSWVDLFGCSIFNPIAWTAPSSGTGLDYKVYQQQINWDLPLTTKGGGTETNLDRALRGEVPFVVKNGRYEKINLHHSKQSSKGPLFELSKSTHDRYYGSNALHPHLPNKNPLNPVDRALFDVDREAYWISRAETVQKSRSISAVMCKK